MSGEILKKLSSIRLTVSLLMLLAALGALGTFQPWPQGLPAEEYERLYGAGGQVITFLGLDSFHKGFLYRALFTLFCLNLFSCAFRRTLAGVDDFSARGEPRAVIRVDDAKVAAAALESAGFSVSKDGGSLLAFRRRYGFLGFGLVHMAPLAIALGAFWGSVGGFVATENVYAGSSFNTVYEWVQKRDYSLPFTITVHERRISYFPGELKLKALAGSGEPVEFLVKVGEEAAIEGTGSSALIEDFNPDNGNLSYYILENGIKKGPFSKGREEGAPIRVRPVAFKGFDVKRVEAPVEVSDAAGNVVKSWTLAVNEPLFHDGYKIFLTAWGQDDAGNPTVGLQITRDPGEALVWVGSTVLAIGIFILLFAQGGWATHENGILRVKCPPAVLKKLREEIGEGAIDH